MKSTAEPNKTPTYPVHGGYVSEKTHGVGKRMVLATEQGVCHVTQYMVSLRNPQP